MLIDWFTVAAQFLNFLVLVWLLKRYLYQPVLSAIDAREQRIAAELATAHRQQVQAQEQRDSLQHKNAEFDQQREACMAAARSEALAERQRLLNEAQQEVEGQRARRLAALESELQQRRNDIALRTRTEVLAIANKVLGELAGTGLEQRMVDVFLRRLQELGAAEKLAWSQILQAAVGSALVRSSFELAPGERQSIQQALQGIVATGLQVRFETDPGLICGLELSTDGWKLAWNIADFMGTLEQQVKGLPTPGATVAVAGQEP